MFCLTVLHVSHTVPLLISRELTHAAAFSWGVGGA